MGINKERLERTYRTVEDAETPERRRRENVDLRKFYKAPQIIEGAKEEGAVEQNKGQMLKGLRNILNSSIRGNERKREMQIEEEMCIDGVQSLWCK